MLPREHGAWAMWLVPYLLGSALGGWGIASLMLLISMLFLFISSRPAEFVLTGPTKSSEAQDRRTAAYGRLTIYAGIGVVAAAVLLLRYHRWALLPLGAVAALALSIMLPLKARRLDRSWPARLLSIAALSAMGPAAYYVGSGTLDHRAFAVWLLGFLYSGASVFYVRLFYRPPARKRPATATDPRRSAERDLFVYLAVVLALLIASATVGWAPPFAGLALAPFLAKAVWAILHRGYQPTLKQLGMGEIGHSAVFALTAFAVMILWV
ncbi:MAG TPA: YwiC-like family protein [Chloroflexota bacterium]|nr:YwiC-like family protein [Chloroflexota bacterium]